MTPEERELHSYLGDGVYAYYDGYHIRLRANDHRDEHFTDQIFLDPDVLEALNNFHQHVTKKKEAGNE